MSVPFLAEMAGASLARVRTARQLVSEAVLAERAARCPPPPPLHLAAEGFDVIAELKLRSPAAGQLGTPALAVGERVREYARAGAAVVSVLTEPARFDGSLEHLIEAQQALTPLGVPVMRKDFLVDPYQVLEARVAGAGGVLVILRLLSPAATGALIDCACACGLFVLLEAFDAADLTLMHDLVAAHAGSGTLLAGLNCRDLATLEVVPQRLTELAPLLPAGVPHVAESGVAVSEDARRAAADGYDLILVGSALMRERNPAALVSSLLAAGRAVRGVR